MRLALCLCLLSCLISASAATAAAPTPAPYAKARLAGCETALQQQGRQATFTGDMRTIPGASRLQIKFVLQAKIDGEPGWDAVKAAGFGTWNTSEAGIARFVYAKTVANLPASAHYRTVVRFRWLSATGRVVQRARRTSRVCRQPDLRPDLVPERLSRLADGYVLTLANDGRTDAGPFVVTLSTAGHVQEFARVQRVVAGGRLRVVGQAPECHAGETLVVRVDAEKAVDEADEDANELVATCPARPDR